MSYRLCILLGVASMALAHGTPKYGPEPVAPYPTLHPTSGTGVHPSGALPTGSDYSVLTARPSGMPSGHPVGTLPLERVYFGPSTVCLTPTVLPGHDTKDPGNVDPKHKHTLHYTGANSPGRMLSIVRITFKC